MATFDVDVVGRLLDIQEFLETLPAEDRIAAFVADQLRTFPGVAAVHLCLRGTLYPTATDGTLSGACAGTAKLADEPASFVAPIVPNLLVVPVATHRHLYGFLAVALSEGQDAGRYDRLIRTTARYLAQVLATRDEVELLGQANRMLAEVGDEVEARVRERTTDLSRRLRELTGESARRERIAAALSKGEERVGVVAMSAPEAIVVIDQNDTIQFWNPAAERLTGYSAQEAIGMHLHTWLAPERYRAQASAGLKRFFGNGDGAACGAVLEVAARRKDGNELPVELSIAAMPWNGGRGAVGVVRDVSAQREEESALSRLERVMEETIEALIATFEIRDRYTAGHQRRVAALATAIGHEMGLSDERIHGLRLAAVVHDLGKINVPVEILTRPGKLTPMEWAVLKTHPRVGYDILAPLQFPWPIAQTVLQHHERFDGSGYPNGLKGDAILLEARILAVADVMETMNTHRPYRPSLGLEATLTELRGGRGTRYDPAVVDALLRVVAGDHRDTGREGTAR